MPPISMPIAAGANDHLPQLDAPSSDGIKSDHIDAASITPAAKPRKTAFTFSGILFLNKNTHADPNEVAAKMMQNPTIVIAVSLICHLLLLSYDNIIQQSRFVKK